MNIKGQGHPLVLVKGHSEFKIIACFFSETAKTFETKFHMKAYGLLLCFHSRGTGRRASVQKTYGRIGMKIYINRLSDMTKMARWHI